MTMPETGDLGWFGRIRTGNRDRVGGGPGGRGKQLHIMAWHGLSAVAWRGLATSLHSLAGVENSPPSLTSLLFLCHLPAACTFLYLEAGTNKKTGELHRALWHFGGAEERGVQAGTDGIRLISSDPHPYLLLSLSSLLFSIYKT